MKHFKPWFLVLVTALVALSTAFIAFPATRNAPAGAGPPAPGGTLVAAAGGSRDMFHAMLAMSRDRGRVAPTQPVDVLLVLRDPTAARQAADLAAIYNPHSPHFGHYLTPRRLAASYGPSPAAIGRIRALFQREGLAVQWQRGNDWLVVTGQARHVEAAFKVRVHTYISPRGIHFYASPRDPTVPRALRALVSGAGHISSYAQPFPQLPQAVPQGGLTPTDLLDAYDIKPLRDLGMDGTGETVAFYESDGFNQQDLDTFSQQYNLPPLQPTIMAGPALPPGGETEMDLEVVHEIAPGAKLLIYNMDFSSMKNSSNDQILGAITSLQSQMVNNNPGAVISESWGLCDKALGAANVAPYQDIYNHADALGESVFASTGDNGAFECLQFAQRGTAPTTQYLGAVVPSSAPGVTAVGGTRLSVAVDKSWYNETVWEDPVETGGGGGNISDFFSMPSWQQGPGVAQPQYNPNNMREVPDVSADADPVSGAAVYLPGSGGGGGQWTQGGGTSQSAPIWAGITALIDQYLQSKGLRRVGFINPALYHFYANPPQFYPFHDVTEGTNLYYPATRGYDLATGLGTPDAWNLARDLEQYEKGGGQ